MYMWFHFLLGRWQVLPEDVQQQVMAYDIWRTASRLPTCCPAFLDEVHALERTLTQVAQRYGWKDDQETEYKRIHCS